MRASIAVGRFSVGVLGITLAGALVSSCGGPGGGGGDGGGGACQPGETESCTFGSGASCQVGTRRCGSDGRFGACEDLEPAPSACACNRACTTGSIGSGMFDPTPASSGGVVENPNGNLVLSTEQIRAAFAWIAGDRDPGGGTVSKLDLETGREVGRFFVGCGGGLENRPSRTAVDALGSVYVASRAHGPGNGCGEGQCFGFQGTVTKIAGDERFCVDRNGNATIDTSRDANDDGHIANPDEMAPRATDANGFSTDECVLWTADVGPPGAWPRALAVAQAPIGGDAMTVRSGVPWVGTFHASGSQRGSGVFYRLNPANGAIEAEVPVPLNPYGAAIAQNLLWTTDIDTGFLAAIDTRTDRLLTNANHTDGLVNNGRPAVNGCNRAYGIAVDGQGRVYLGGVNCKALWRYTPGASDPLEGTWEVLDLGGNGRVRGVAIDTASPPNVWLARDSNDGTASALERIPLDRFNVQSVVRYDLDGDKPDFAGELRPARGMIGVQLDFMGNVWGVNQSSSTATKFDPRTGEWQNFAVGNRPYTYSDFTGFAFQNFTQPQGYWNTIFEGCPMGVTDWGLLHLDADIPTGTSVSVRVRTANSPDAFADPDDPPWVDIPTPPPPVDVGAALEQAGIAPGNYVEVELVLRSEDCMTSPVVRGVRLERICLGNPQG